MGKKEKKGQKGTAVLYTTRNRALKKLQVKLPAFRRLSILKGVHPREPKKKVAGRGKTYYHVKDVNFLLHEPLLDTFRDQQAYDKKIVRAIGKNNEALARKLESRRPEARLDHLVRERYPSFVDALRDLDDPLTLVHLFASLPADRRHEIAANRCNNARRLCLEWSAYVVRMRALKKVYVSVKGIYFEAVIKNERVVWLTPHMLVQRLPEDVDYRVMTTFLEFYETFLSFVLFRLYHDIGLRYPPDLGSSLEEAGVGVGAVMGELAAASGATITGTQGDGDDSEDDSEDDNGPEKKAPKAKGRGEAGGAVAIEADDDVVPNPVLLDDEGSAGENLLFSGLVFFVGREVPREVLVMCLVSFGATVGWEGAESPFAETSPKITHHVVDRPFKGDRQLEREYVQPQWVFDSINFEVLAPAHLYAPGVAPPPHLSPFVDNEAEGYTPEYAETLKALKSSSSADVSKMVIEKDQRNERATDLMQTEQREREEAHAKELQAEADGIPYSAAVEAGGIERARRQMDIGERAESDGDTDSEGDDEGDEDNVDGGEGKRGRGRKMVEEKDDEEEFAKTMMSSKNRKLYERIKVSKERKKAKAETLRAKRKSIKSK